MSSIYVIRRIKKEHIAMTAENVKLTLSDERLHIVFFVLCVTFQTDYMLISEFSFIIQRLFLYK